MSDNSQQANPEIDHVGLGHLLGTMAELNGVAYGRLSQYWEAELQHVTQFRNQHDGTLTISRTCQCFFLETIELFNRLTDTIPQEGPTFYTRFVAKLVQTFRQLCASDLLATHGYPLPAFAQLRNVFDHLVLISAAMQNLTDLFEIEGINPQKAMDLNESKRMRKNAERRVRDQMTGKSSGLSESTKESLLCWNDLFDFEVHGSKLSLGMAANFVHGKSKLAVIPQYENLSSITYVTRNCEITWMLHRLLPLLQHSAMRFPDDWRVKWHHLDDAIELAVRHFANQQLRKDSLAVIELVDMKFPFSAQSGFPLEACAPPCR